MNAIELINVRIQRLLRTMDKQSMAIRRLKSEESLRVRDGSGRAVLLGYRACQFCTMVEQALGAARQQLFTDPAVNYNGPKGELTTEQNRELLCLRFNDTAGNLGLTFEEVADAVLEVAEAQSEVAQNALQEALRWAARS
ncbi:MAG: hypothetical protein K2W95_28705 [Candidatus Obscuribacterales bacterium]|nr:hypothetical protein [Candidatus Obscuribacterales bacterium]